MILAGPDILSRGSSTCVNQRSDLQSQRILFNAIRIALKNKDATSKLSTGDVNASPILIRYPNDFTR